MKQKTPTSTTTTTPRSVLKHHQQQQHSDNKSLQSVPQTTTTTTRLRVKASSKAKESPKTPPEIVNRVSTISSTRAKSVPPDMKNNSKAKRSIFMKSIEEEVESSHKGSREGEVAKVVVVAPPRRRRIEDDDPDVKEKKELLEKLAVSENLIKSLQSEVKALKDELNQVKSLNIDLESQNIKLNQNLASAEAKIAAFGTSSTRKVRNLYMTLFHLLQSAWNVFFVFLHLFCSFKCVNSFIRIIYLFLMLSISNCFLSNESDFCFS